jgi:hypothetical protein
MIEGARNGIPPAPHWDIYRAAKRDYPRLIESLEDAILRHMDGKREVSSTAAGNAILSIWEYRDEWNQHFGADSSKLFGMVMRATFFGDDAQLWRSRFETVEGCSVRVYCLVDPSL